MVRQQLISDLVDALRKLEERIRKYHEYVEFLEEKDEQRDRGY